MGGTLSIEKCAHRKPQSNTGNSVMSFCHAIRVRWEWENNESFTILSVFNRFHFLCLLPMHSVFRTMRQRILIHALQYSTECILIGYEVASHGLQFNSMGFCVAAAVVNIDSHVCIHTYIGNACVYAKCTTIFEASISSHIHSNKVRFNWNVLSLSRARAYALYIYRGKCQHEKWILLWTKNDEFMLRPIGLLNSIPFI